MKTWILTLMVVLLSGCVTVLVPQAAPQTVTAEPASHEDEPQCTPYRPPNRRSLPDAPMVAEIQGRDYTAYLESLSEQLALHIGALRDYIDEEHEIEDEAQRLHLLSCPQQ